MKKPFLFECLIVVGCHSMDSNLNFTKEIDENLIMQTMTAPDAGLQKSMYNNLTIKEKSYIWQDRITSFIEKNELTANQKEQLILLKDKLTPAFFELPVENVKRVEKEWGNEALKIFDKKDLIVLLGSLGDVPNLNANTKKANGRVLVAECACNGDSMFDCSACNTQDACTRTSHGCGFVFYYSCEKSCSIAPVDQ